MKIQIIFKFNNNFEYVGGNHPETRTQFEYDDWKRNCQNPEQDSD